MKKKNLVTSILSRNYEIANSGRTDRITRYCDIATGNYKKKRAGRNRARILADNIAATEFFSRSMTHWPVTSFGGI